MDKLNTGDLAYIKVYPDVIIFSPQNIFAPIPTSRYVAWGYENIKDFFLNGNHSAAGISIETQKKNPVNGVVLDHCEYSLHKYHHTYNILLFYKLLVTKNHCSISLWFPEEDVLGNLVTLEPVE